MQASEKGVVDCYLALFRPHMKSKSTQAWHCSKNTCYGFCEVPLCTCENQCMQFGVEFIRYMPMFRGDAYVQSQTDDDCKLYLCMTEHYEWRVLPDMTEAAFAVVQKLVRDSGGNLFQWYGVTYYEDPVYNKLCQVELNSWYSCHPTVYWHSVGKPDHLGRVNEIRVSLQEYLEEERLGKSLWEMTVCKRGEER